MEHLLLFLFWTHLSDPTLKESPNIEPLEGALWHGVLNISIKGPVYSQFLANKLRADGVPIGYIKEKGEMRIDYDLELQFLVNSLGEYSLLAVDRFEGKQTLKNDYRYRFKEEKVVEKSRLKIDQEVHVSESTLTVLRFSQEATYLQDEFDHGSFRLFPSGRMDKKGLLRVMGNFEIKFTGEGKVTFTKERQPPSKEYARIKKVQEIQKSFVLPIRFDFEIAFKRKAVAGSMAITAAIENPFKRTDEATGKPSLFTNSIQISGRYRLTPYGAANK